jgi:hypothetical protein
MPNDDRRFGERRCHPLNVFDVVAQAVPDSSRRSIVAAKLHSPGVVAALGQMMDEVVPTPRTVPGTVN